MQDDFDGIEHIIFSSVEVGIGDVDDKEFIEQLNWINTVEKYLFFY